MDEFNADYYAALAQVIPIFFLAAVASRLFRSSGKDMPTDLNLFLIIVVASVLAGEASVLTALQQEEEPTGAEEAVIGLALGFPLLLIVVEAVYQPFTALASKASPALRLAGRIASLVGPLVLFGLAIWCPEAFGAAIAAIVVGLIAVYGFMIMRRDFRAMRGSDDEDPDEDEDDD